MVGGDWRIVHSRIRVAQSDEAGGNSIIRCITVGFVRCWSGFISRHFHDSDGGCFYRQNLSIAPQKHCGANPTAAYRKRIPFAAYNAMSDVR